MKKVFASDFDGTLYFYKAEVKLYTGISASIDVQVSEA